MATVRWRTDTGTCTNSSFWYRANSTSATADGTTCTMRGDMWTAAAGAGAGIAIGLAHIGQTITSAGQTLCWAQGAPRPYRGPSRGAGLHRERIGGYGYESSRNRAERRMQEKMRKDAHETSMKLLRQWLSEMEYNYLMEQGQLELPSQYEKDTIYIVKKDALAKVKIASKKKLSCIHQPLIIETGDACININPEYPLGDILLSKIAMLKSDEKQFLDIANVNYYPPRVPLRHAVQFNPQHIVRERGTNFWFVLLDESGRCTTAFETSRHLQFEGITHQEVPSESVAIGNDILIPNSRQYFIWSLDMIYAVNRARKFYKNREREIEDALHQAARDVEREHQNVGFGFVARWDGPQEEIQHNNDPPLVRYANSTYDEIPDGPTYTTTTLGQQGDEEYEEVQLLGV